MMGKGFEMMVASAIRAAGINPDELMEKANVLIHNLNFQLDRFGQRLDSIDSRLSVIEKALDISRQKSRTISPNCRVLLLKVTPMTNEEKLIAEIDSAGLSAEMLESMPSPEMFPLILVNLQGRIAELEARESEMLARVDALIARLAHLGVA